MAERIVSPGVFTRERDLSFLTQGISEIGGAFIGPTPKGPAFIPTIVRSQQEYVTRFGEADANHYTGLTVKNYLREAGVATVVRVLGTEGYSSGSSQPAVILVTSGSKTRVFAVLHPTNVGETTEAKLYDVDITSDASNFTLTVTASIGGVLVSSSKSGLSLDTNSTSSIVDYLGTSPNGTVPAYVYSVFPEALTEVNSTFATSPSILSTFTPSIEINWHNLSFVSSSYSNAATPWIQSQKFGASAVNLFKLHTLSDGNSANKEIKVSFANMKPSDDPDYAFGTFSMLIRRFDDTDARMEILEQYENLNLDPDSPQFIARVIGDSAPTEDQVTGEMYYQGDFPNNSQYIYVEMASTTIPETAVPFGFAAVETPFGTTAQVSASYVVAPTYVNTRWYNGDTGGYSTAAIDKRYYYGWDFSTNESYLAPIPDEGSVSAGSAFGLEALIDVPNGATSKSIALGDADSFNYRKFTVPFQGGFDGLNPARIIKMGGDMVATNSQGFDLSTSLSDGSVAYKKALNAISNPDQFDFNLLVLPGVIYELHSYVANEALTVCEDRGDAFYIMDTTGLNATLATATSKAGEIDSNYAATYYPWLRVIDTNTNRMIWVPPSVILPEIYAYNDNVAAEWFAPAGLNRGGIASAVGVKVRLPQASRDTLYEGRVNPIAQFPGQGICVWGQKTLQRRPSALDRVNVRRLLIAVKKYIASSARYLVFEQNIEATRNRFLNIVNPYLASVQERSGLYAFRVIMDETNNTNDLIDRNILYGQLYLQPTKTAEFVVLDFNVLPTGAVFPTA